MNREKEQYLDAWLSTLNPNFKGPRDASQGRGPRDIRTKSRESSWMLWASFVSLSSLSPQEGEKKKIPFNKHHHLSQLVLLLYDSGPIGWQWYNESSCSSNGGGKHEEINKLELGTNQRVKGPRILNRNANKNLKVWINEVNYGKRK